ncbi:MAG: PEP-CTERM sorting domain-containing protein [Verrucomicrobiales bacterium]|nr:PEP-CTERM sorting domain-containing protein [Verrucomicrobiales bacterium]
MKATRFTSALNVVVVGLLLSSATSEALLYFDFQDAPLPLEIPDGRLEGTHDTRTITAPFDRVVQVEVSITLAPGSDGAFAGDLYVTLVHEDRMAVLLNRPGRERSNRFGYGDSGGFSVTLRDDARLGDIHTYQRSQSLGLGGGNSAPLENEWQPDGRTADPTVVTTEDPRTAMLSQFVGTDPNGEWTLFLADASGGGAVALQSWSLQFGFATVPDTGSTALASAFATGLVMVMAERHRRWCYRAQAGRHSEEHRS